MKNNHNLKICLVTLIFHKAFISPVSNLESILSAIAENELCVIEVHLKNINTKEKNKIRKFRIMHTQKKNFFSRMIRFLYYLIRIPLKMIKIAPKIDLFIVFMGEFEFLPIFTAKLLRKKVLILMPSSFPKMKEYDKQTSLILKILRKITIYFHNMSFKYVDNIVLYSKNLMKEWNLEKYENKILIAHEHTLDFELFKINNKIDERENLIGFIGRLSKEKGILNFIESINAITKERKDIRFIIIGNGNLKKDIETFLENNQLNHYVDIIGWIPHHKLPEYLNKLKLLVLPSYTEGLPNIILEAMACGTPVLATNVGAISDMIVDSKTGFIITDNDPNNISSNIVRAIEHDNINEIANNSYNFVKNEFSFEKNVENWKKIIYSLNI